MLDIRSIENIVILILEPGHDGSSHVLVGEEFPRDRLRNRQRRSELQDCELMSVSLPCPDPRWITPTDTPSPLSWRPTQKATDCAWPLAAALKNIPTSSKDG
jgi:hypothetical protein